ncbi:hypothetical protein [Phenylobacterium sp.]|jgi:hypothetical protein|uniref:hypothetical protein n=1 Tax=Phenylobacterium sp. TaxID=1871053 RepID=UPI002F42E8E5
MNRLRPSPPPLVRPRELRLDWRGWLAAARARAAAALDGAGLDKREEFDLVHGAVRTAQTVFPVADAPAQGMARAFAALAKTFVETTDPARRAQMAPALERLAAALDDILDEPAMAAARAARVQQGERE